MERWTWKGVGISGSSEKEQGFSGMKGPDKEREPQRDPNVNRDPGREDGKRNWKPQGTPKGSGVLDGRPQKRVGAFGSPRRQRGL